MSIVEEIISLQEQGYTDEEIISWLQERGLTPNEIEQALNQSKIKTAVTGEEEQEQQYDQQDTDQGYQQEYQQQYQEYPPAETISEIVDQLLAEKLKRINESISILIDFKISIETKITDVNSRLKKVEDQLDSIRDSVIGKIGNYGRQIETVNREIEAMQDSFGKMVNPLTERARAIRIRQKNKPARTTKPKAKRKRVIRKPISKHIEES